jgi:hypothetical protein
MLIFGRKQKNKKRKRKNETLKNFRIFESSGVTELDIEEYLKSKFTSDWFDSELSDRVYEYIDEDNADNYGVIMKKLIGICLQVVLLNMI